MSVETKVGALTRDVMGAVADAVNFNLSSMLKSDVKLADEQIMRITSIVRSTIENVGMNGVNQYVSLINEISTEKEAPKRNKLFG
jgi:hypothetical protein